MEWLGWGCRIRDNGVWQTYIAPTNILLPSRTLCIMIVDCNSDEELHVWCHPLGLCSMKRKLQGK